MLANPAQLGAQGDQIHLRNILAVEQDASLGRLKKARHQLHDGGFAAARSAHQSQSFAGAQFQAEILHRPGLLTGVAETHAFKAHMPARPWHRAGGRAGRFGWGIEQLKQRLRTGQAALNHVIDVREAADGLKQHRHSRHKSDKGAWAQAVLRRQVGRQPNHSRNGHCGKHLHQRHIQRADAHGAHGGGPQVFGDRGKTRCFVGLGAEYFDFPNARQTLLNGACHSPGTFLHGLVAAAQFFAGDGDQPGDDGRDGQDQQRQLPRCIDQVAGQADDDQGIAHHHNPRGGQRRADLRDVVQQAREHAPLRLRHVLCQGQLHLVRKHLAAQIGDGFVGNPLAGDVCHVFGHAFC